MGVKKKQGKERLDKYYHLAKSQGYRARSAFKLIQLNKKYNFLEKSRVLIDLCAAPGGWLQVAAKYMPISSLIVGVDLAAIKPIPRVITHVEDITTEKCRSTLKKDLKDWKADVVLHDGAPNVGSAWSHDAYTQSELTLSSLKLATEFLAKGGTFVTKVFRSKDYNNLMWVFQQLFSKVEATKPPSSRTVSAEIFVVCQGFLAPKKIDPRFMDPRFVFKDLEAGDAASGTAINQGTINDLLFPEKASAKRKRDGYSEGDYTLHHTHTVEHFLRVSEPEAIGILARCHTLTWDESGRGKDEPEAEADAVAIDMEAVQAHVATDAELVECLRDLRVLGRKDFKSILRWRKLIRRSFNIDGKSTADLDKVDNESEDPVTNDQTVVTEDVDDLLATLDTATADLGREEHRAEKRRREKLAKERRRMQLNMTTPADIGQEENLGDLVDDLDMEQVSTRAGGDLFALRELSKTATAADLQDADVDQHEVESINSGSDSDDEYADEFFGDSDDDDQDSDEERHAMLAGEMDQHYDQHMQDLTNKNPKMKVKQLRAKERPFTGADEYMQKEESSDAESDAVDSANERPLADMDEDCASDSMSDDFTEGEDEQPVVMSAASKKANVWFSQSVFNDVVDLKEPAKEEAPPAKKPKLTKQERITAKLEAMARDDDEGSSGNHTDDETAMKRAKEQEELLRKTHETLSTSEAITLAMKMAQDGRREQRDVLDDYGYNRYAFNDDVASLPKWFVDDEAHHTRPNRPITKEAVDLMKQRQRELDARPIKKVMESKARKKHKMLQRLEKMRKKTNSVLDEGTPDNCGDDPEFGAKLGQVSSMVKKAVSKAKALTRTRTKVVVASGSNKANPGRPRGVKGRYKMVDSRMKKEVRSEKRRKKANNPGNRRKK